MFSAGRDDCVCRICGRAYKYRPRSGRTKTRCTSCCASRPTPESREALKRDLIAERGSRCELCGYDRCLHALCFHHATGLKRFRIAGNHNRSVQALKAEIAKCVLLCRNCHAQVHAGLDALEARRTERSHVAGRTQLPLSADPRACICQRCGRHYEHDYTKGHTRKVCNSCRSGAGGRAGREALKRRMAHRLGGRCCNCGYDRCARALCFHHVDETTKRFNLAGSHLRSRASLEAELAKCILLCENCHAELHAGLIKAPSQVQTSTH
jgi:ribosomal protein L30E